LQGKTEEKKYFLYVTQGVYKEQGQYIKFWKRNTYADEDHNILPSGADMQLN
jgi:hypothetical protein